MTEKKKIELAQKPITELILTMSIGLNAMKEIEKCNCPLCNTIKNYLHRGG